LAPNLKALWAVARGAAAAAKDPRKLTRLLWVLPEERERRYRAAALEALNGMPRTVPIERFLPPLPVTLPLLSFLDDTSTIPDLLLLVGLMTRFPSGRFFEVGTLRGEAAIAVAEVAQSVVTLSLPDESLAAQGSDVSFIRAHRAFSTGHPRIRHLLDDSRTMDLGPFQGWADVIFIDGDHRYDAVECDTRRFWNVRRSEESIVVWHDAFVTALQPRWEVLAGIAAGLPADRRAGLVHVSNTMCVAWLPDAAQLPTVELSYVPRLAFRAAVELERAWPNVANLQTVKPQP
jgi:hypothetical protein